MKSINNGLFERERITPGLGRDWEAQEAKSRDVVAGYVLRKIECAGEIKLRGVWGK